MKSTLLFMIFLILMAFAVCRDTDYYLHKLGICRQTYHSCESGSKNIYCSCDWMCIYYDNCCYDAAAIKGDQKEMSEEDQRRQYLKLTTCEVIAFRKDDLLSQSAFMISFCPVSGDTDMDTRQACELYTETGVRDRLPVVDTSTNLTFKNRHCAKCHSVQKYIPWLLEIKCLPEKLPPSHSITDGVMTKIHSDHCSYRYIPPNGVTVHYCYQEFDYRIINFSERDSNSTCQNRVFSPVLIIQQGRDAFCYFRTLPCLIAKEGPKYTDVLEDITCALQEYNTDGLDSFLTLSSLIDFSALLQEQVTKCKDDEIQLSEKVDCQRLYCPARSEPSGGECVDIHYTSDGLMIDLLFEVNTFEVSSRTLSRIFQIIIDGILLHLGNRTGSVLMYNDEYFQGIDITPGIQWNSGNICSVIRLHNHIKGLSLTGDTLESERSWTANFVKNYTAMNTDGSVIKHVANVHDMSCKTNVSIRNPLYIHEMISVDNDLPCPAVQLQYSTNESDSEGHINNETFVLYRLQMINVSPFDVVFANGDYFLCIDTLLSKYLRDFQQHDTVASYRSYINTVCAILSMICMIYCLVQYCFIPIYRDGKSDLLIVLILFLLFAQTCFFSLSYFEVPFYVCELVGIVHHFTWLCAFAFMFLCPYRFNAEIRDLQTFSKSERFIITVKYILVGISFSLFVVICTKATNIILSPTEKWYGGRLCFISETFAALFSFVVPIFLILCGNTFLFVNIIRYITSTSISPNSNKSNVTVFIKISTVMGFSWIIGITAIICQSDLLLLVFEILANLQGVFITISFSSTNRVWTFYKECFQQFKNQS